MSAAHRRELAREAVEQEDCSQRQACRFFDLNRSTYRYQAKYPSLQALEREQAIVDLSQEHPELGADKIARLVRKRGYRVSNGRVREVRREEGLVVPPPKKKQRRRWSMNTPVRFMPYTWTGTLVLKEGTGGDGRTGSPARSAGLHPLRQWAGMEAKRT